MKGERICINPGGVGTLSDVDDCSAVFSTDMLYRYALRRQLGNSRLRCVFVMLNPSTANEWEDDPTIRKCRGFARSLGCGVLDVVNLYAFRSTDPRQLWKAHDPIGPDNDAHIDSVCTPNPFNPPVIICAWGAHAGEARAADVAARLSRRGVALHALGFTKKGQPRHPLMLAYSTPLEPWDGP